MEIQPIALNFERELNFTTPSGTQQGKLVISHLEYRQDRRAWACYWRLDFVKLHLSAVYGGDPIESLTGALWIASELVRNSGVPDLQIWWRTPGDNGGLQEIRADEEFRNRKSLR